MLSNVVNNSKLIFLNHGAFVLRGETKGHYCHKHSLDANIMCAYEWVKYMVQTPAKTLPIRNINARTRNAAYVWPCRMEAPPPTGAWYEPILWNPLEKKKKGLLAICLVAGETAYVLCQVETLFFFRFRWLSDGLWT